MSKPEDATGATARYRKAREALEGWFVPGKRWLPFGMLADGSIYDAQSSWQSFALAYGRLDSRVAEPAAASLRRRELSTTWGTRLFATDSPYYDPLGYNDGSVWPFVTGFAMMAEFRNGQPRSALEHLYGVAAMTGLSGAGFLTENLSGDRAQALPRSVPHQLFSSSAVVHPLISGLLGLDGDAVQRRLTIQPRVPAAWPTTRWKNYRVGDSLVSGEITTTNNLTTVRASVVGPPLRIEVASDKGQVRNGNCASCNSIEATMPVSPERAEPLPFRAPEIGERAR
jgi:glycogen debranching enzyme